MTCVLLGGRSIEDTQADISQLSVVSYQGDYDATRKLYCKDAQILFYWHACIHCYTDFSWANIEMLCATRFSAWLRRILYALALSPHPIQTLHP